MSARNVRSYQPRFGVNRLFFLPLLSILVVQFFIYLIIYFIGKEVYTASAESYHELLEVVF